MFLKKFLVALSLLVQSSVVFSQLTYKEIDSHMDKTLNQLHDFLTIKKFSITKDETTDGIHVASWKKRDGTPFVYLYSRDTSYFDRDSVKTIYRVVSKKRLAFSPKTITAFTKIQDEVKAMNLDVEMIINDMEAGMKFTKLRNYKHTYEIGFTKSRTDNNNSPLYIVNFMFETREYFETLHEKN